MGDAEDVPGTDSDRVVERGETYEHAQHGRVEVSGIWRGVEEVDAARNTDQKDVIIVRYSAEIEGEQVEELTDTLGEFLAAME